MGALTVVRVFPRPVTWLLVVLASVVLPLAMVSTWVAGLVSDTDRYVETVAPLAEDEVVVDIAHDHLEREVLQAIGAPANTSPRINEGIDQALNRVLTGPEFPPAWRVVNRTAHTEALRVLEGRAPVGVDEAGERWVQLDLAPLADAMLAAVGRELGIEQQIDLADRDLSIDVVRESDVAQARDYYGLLETAGFWLPVAWLVLVGVTLLTARRRIAALGHLAVGSLVTLALLAVALLVARQEVIAAAATGGTADEALLQVLWDTATRGLWAALWTAAGIAALALVMRVVLGVVVRSRPRAA